LKPGGKDVVLTAQNRREYLVLMMRYQLLDGVKHQVRREGGREGGREGK